MSAAGSARRSPSESDTWLGSGCRLQTAGNRAQTAGCRMQGAGLRVQAAGGRLQGSGVNMLRHVATAQRSPSLSLSCFITQLGR